MEQVRPTTTTTTLDRERIVATALQLAQTPDKHAVSFRRLGTELGVDPTALYRYFPSKAELVDATLDRLYQQVIESLPERRAWRPQLATLVERFVMALLAHPAVAVEAGRRSTGGPGEAVGSELVVSCLEEAGLGPDDIARYWGIFTSLAWTFASERAYVILAHAAAPGDAPPTPLTAPSELSSYPALSRYFADIETLDWADVFSTALEALLDSIEKRAAS